MLSCKDTDYRKKEPAPERPTTTARAATKKATSREKFKFGYM